jgi:hypothetical protein
MERERERERRVEAEPLPVIVSPTVKVDALTVMKIAEKVTALQKDASAVEAQHAANRTRGELREILKKSYEQAGVAVSDQIIESAVDRHLNESYDFQAPPKDLRYHVARLWVERWSIALIVSFVLLVMGTVGAAAWRDHHAKRLEQRAAATRAIDATSERCRRLENEVSELAAEDVPAPVKKRIDATAAESKERLAKLERELEAAKSAEVPETRGARELDEIEGRLQQARSQVEVVKRAETLRTDGALFLKWIRGSSSSPAVLEQAEKAQRTLEQALDGGEIAQAQEARDALSVLSERAQKLASLPGAVKSAHDAIAAIVQDAGAREQSDRLLAESLACKEAGNVERLSQIKDELEGLGQRLDADYTLVITGGKWRYLNSDPSVKHYYLIVEARDARGARLARSVRDEERGVTETVEQWGERVPKAVYDAVAHDKQSHGFIEDSVFGKKARGTLDERILFKDPGGTPLSRSGEITRW